MFKFLNSKQGRVLSNRVLWIGNQVFIEGYQKIMEISTDKISTKSYIISGSNLKIESLDGYLVEITGNIENVQRGLCDEHL